MKASPFDPFEKRAASYGAANKLYPLARRAERAQIFEGITLRPDTRAIDLQSASGYVGEGIVEQDPSIEITCIEPSLSLARETKATFPTICGRLDRIPLPDRSFDYIFGLAAFHHSESLDGIMRECARLLKAGGIFSGAEVMAGTREDRWLNDFVDRHTDGHDGHFVHRGDFQSKLKKHGFTQIHEAPKQTQWLTANRDEFLIFCKTLFGLNCSLEHLDSQIDDYLAPEQFGKRYGIQWELLYARGLRE